MVTPTTRAEFKEYVLKNKYSNWYFNIIEKATQRDWNKREKKDVYLERHHVIPRALTKQTLYQGDRVDLTAKEHFVCHLLLTKMFENKQIKMKMHLALHRLVSGNKKEYLNLNSKMYSEIQKMNSKACSERTKEYWKKIPKEERSKMRSGENHPQFGNHHTEETKDKISKTKKEKYIKENHPLWGIGHTEESKQIMSKNAGRAALGKKWFNDGLNNFLIFPTEIKDGWIKGRINIYKNPSKHIIGKKWFNNGKDNFLIFPQENNAFKLGRLRTW